MSCLFVPKQRNSKRQPGRFQGFRLCIGSDRTSSLNPVWTFAYHLVLVLFLLMTRNCLWFCFWFIWKQIFEMQGQREAFTKEIKGIEIGKVACTESVHNEEPDKSSINTRVRGIRAERFIQTLHGIDDAKNLASKDSKAHQSGLLSLLFLFFLVSFFLTLVCVMYVHVYVCMCRLWSTHRSIENNRALG